MPPRSTASRESRAQSIDVPPILEDVQVEKKEDRSKHGSHTLLYVVGICLVLAGFGSAYFFYNKYSEVKNNPNIESQREVDDLSRKVGMLIELPIGETPTVATVLDKNKIKDQKFFARAENGDKLLAYTKAMKAILYRPSINKIIEVAPIVLNNNASSTDAVSAKQSAPAKIRIAYYNGTKTSGLTGTAEAILQTKFDNITTASKANAAKDTYRQTLIVDLIGKYTQEAGYVAQALNGVVGTIPDGEAKPDADILVILGE